MHTKVEQELNRGEKLSIITLVESIIEDACLRNASDIHIDPCEAHIRIRFRLDGVMTEMYVLPKSIASEIISRIKVVAQLRTDEHQLPQDGRFKVLINDKTIDVRTAIAPTYYGESCILRILPSGRTTSSLDSLGFSENDIARITKTLSRTHGMILVTGPTGSGKTTTLYTLLQLFKPTLSVITIEDPVEYALKSVRQIQVNTRVGFTFSGGLRSILRQDPDVIMVGEIRDTETASIAVNSALTGHLILSTLHTHDASGVLPRLFDMKIEPYLIASVVHLIIAQRLVRKICTKCSTLVPLDASQTQYVTTIFGNAPRKVYVGQGCDACLMTGYVGRIALYEILEVTDHIQKLILEKATYRAIADAAFTKGNATLLRDGYKKVCEGSTTFEEVLRVLYE